MAHTDHRPILAEFAPATYQDWRKAAEESLEGAPFEKKLVTRTPEGIDLQPIYNAADVEKLALPEAWPGLAPFTRGPQALGYKRQAWHITQELPYGSPEEFNRAARLDLARGQTALHLDIDVATRHGQDPDEARPGEVGACGLSVSTVEDLARALEGIDLLKVPLYLWAGETSLQLTGLLHALLNRQKFPIEELKGAVLTDPLSEWARDGALPTSLDELYHEMAALTGWAAQSAPALKTIGVSANLYADAGAHAAQELAYAIATGVDYLREMAGHGQGVDQAAPRFLFTFSLGSQYFMEVAKLRAARLLWARVVAACKGRPESQKMAIHGRTAIWNKTTLDPYVNMLRVTSEAFAGVVGGVDSMHVAPFDESVRLPDDFSRRVARNVQIILAEECGLSQVADPAGGSWYIECLTVELAQKAWALFQEIERAGGMGAALRAGLVQKQVGASNQARADAVARRRDSVVGVNAYPNLKEKPLALTDLHLEEMQKRRARAIADYRVSGDHVKETAVLAKLAAILEAGSPVKRMAAVTVAFQHGATLGEVSKAVRHGAEPPPAIERLRVTRRSEGWEKLRADALAYKEKQGGKGARVWLANFGPPKQHRGRADFSAGFFAAGGFEVAQGKGASSPQDAAQAAAESGAPVVVLCSTDDTYPALVPPFVQALKAARPGVLVILAGYPQEQVAAYRAAGVDDFIHIRLNCLEFLSGLHQRLGLAS